MGYLLRVDSITKDYRNHRALDNVSVQVPEQSVFGLLGPNGAGKTTLIRIINQIIGPDQGTVYFGDKPLSPAHVHEIGYLPEERGLYKKMEVGEQALYLARLKGLKGPALKKLLQHWFDKFDLSPWWNKKVEELSKGMQQKLQFIITVLHNPRLLIFDEPFSGFDPINVNLIKEEILQLRKNGATIIFSTHNMGSVEELCDHIALINKSKKVLEGSIRQIRKDHADHMFQLELEQLNKPLEHILKSGFTLVHSKPHNGLVTARVRIDNQHSPNELLEQLMPFARIISFQELTPSMNDIFIKQVTGKYPSEDTKNG